jgi:zinc and cadmium transporter
MPPWQLKKSSNKRYKYYSYFYKPMGIVIYTILSVILVSLVSLVGIVSLLLKKDLKNYLLILVSLSAGTLFGGAFLHLLPEAVEINGFTVTISLLLLAGVLTFFILEKFIHWRHCHVSEDNHNDEHTIEHLAHNPSHIAPLNLLGDVIHNLLDGLVIAGSYLVSIPAGLATTVAVILHEVPQEIADFGVLLHSGLSKWKALFYNFLSAAAAILGAVVGLMLSSKSEMFISYILPFAAGGFVYIAGSNLIPELHKKCDFKESFWHFIALFVGIALMYILTFL